MPMELARELLVAALEQTENVIQRTPSVVASAAEAVEIYLKSRGIIEGDEGRPYVIRLNGTDLLRINAIALTFLSACYPQDTSYFGSILDNTLLMAETEKFESGMV